MGTTIKAFGLDRNADAADRGLERGVGRLKKKKKKKRVGEGWRERERNRPCQQKGLSN